MGALNIPSAADIERLTRRLRSVSQRLEGIEDSLDRLEERPGAPPRRRRRRRRTAWRRRLDEIARDIAALREAVAPGSEPCRGPRSASPSPSSSRPRSAA